MCLEATNQPTSLVLLFAAKNDQLNFLLTTKDYNTTTTTAAAVSIIKRR